MSCELDNVPIWSRVNVDGPTICHACGNTEYLGATGTYIGHREYPSGKASVVSLDSEKSCSECGEKFNQIYFYCEDGIFFENIKEKVTEQNYVK